MSAPRAATSLALAALLALEAGAVAGQGAARPADQQKKEGSAIETVTLPNADSPLVSLQMMFDVGSIHDPAGKEGLAALTALMIGQAGTRKRSYAELLDALYPLAASISTSIDREATVFGGEVHRDTLDEYTALFEEALLQPGFSESDFKRNKEQLLAYLTTTLRAGDDELLGLEALQGAVFAGHPYGHPDAGTVEGLASITLDDVKSFYKQHYTRANLLLGLAGGYPADYAARLDKDLGALPAGTPGRTELPPALKPKGRRFELISKQTASTGIHLGYPLPVNRADADYFPLMVANSYLGEHRTFHGRLMQQLRGERGFNYGDYSYVEFYANPPSTSNPTAGVPRRQQYFSVWLRPVAPEQAHFALRNALYEIDRLHDKGMTQAELDLTRDFLINYSKLWVQTQASRLGFHMDSRFYGMPYFVDEIEKRLQAMTVEEVNRAARKYLSTDSYVAVLVTGNAEELKAQLQKDDPSPVQYASPVKEEILAADKEIQGLKVRPTAIEIVPVERVFQSGKAPGK